MNRRVVWTVLLFYQCVGIKHTSYFLRSFENGRRFYLFLFFLAIVVGAASVTLLRVGAARAVAVLRFRAFLLFLALSEKGVRMWKTVRPYPSTARITISRWPSCHIKMAFESKCRHVYRFVKFYQCVVAIWAGLFYGFQLSHYSTFIIPKLEPPQHLFCAVNIHKLNKMNW